MNNQVAADKELSQLLNHARALGWVVGLDELAPVLRERLDKLRRGKDIGVRDDEGEPVLSLRKFAKVMGNQKAYSYLSKFARENAMPCITVMNQIANTMGVQYIITNFDTPPQQGERV